MNKKRFRCVLTAHLTLEVTYMWQQKDKYHMTNGSSTICKVKLGDKLTYELWHMGKQYAGFTSADEAKQKHEAICHLNTI